MYKIHLSREMTRQMALDHPIGDPTGGAAYGERNDPISAAISIGAMAASYGSIGMATIGGLMAGLTFAGGALSLIGNISGNKTLSKIGMVAGITGGIGSLASSSGLFGSSQAATGAGSTASSGSGLVKSAAPGAQTPIVDGVKAAGVGQATDVASKMAADAGSIIVPSPDLNVIAPRTGLQQLASGAKELGRDAMSFAKENPAGALVAGNAVTGMANWLSGKSDAEIEQLEGQAALYGARGEQVRFEIEREKERRANLNNGYLQVRPEYSIDTNVRIPMPWNKPGQQFAMQQQNPGLIAGAVTPMAT